MNLNVYSPDGTSQQEKDFPIPQFEGNRGLQALRQVILAHQANQRLGTVSTKTRTTVSGTGKKPFRQKGTGRARQGSWRANQHYHGAVTHGPQPRDWSQKVNKKMRRLALSRALFDRATTNELAVIERWEVSQPKTKLFASIVSKLEPGKGKILLVDASWPDTVALAARNIERLTLTEADHVNALDLCHYSKIIVSEEGIQKILARANGELSQ